MDFKFRLQQQQNKNRQTSGLIFGKQNPNNQNNAPSNWQKYARKTVPATASKQQDRASNPSLQQSMPQQNNKNSLLNDNLKNSTKPPISRYYRADIAPKNQFKHYLSSIQNVFYQQRKTLHQMKIMQNLRWASGIIFVILFLMFISLYFIHPFQGQCPSNAECGVFVHCYKGFKYDKQNNQCILSQQLYDEIQQICTQLILKAREEWGNQQCNQQNEYIPRIKLDQIVSSISNQQLKRQLVNRLQTFLQDTNNQRNLYFDYFSTNQVIMPTLKKYSLLCSFKLFSKTSNFKLGLPIFLFVFILSVLAITSIRRKIISKQIYQFLRKRTIAQKLLNISYAKADVEKQFGSIDQKMWEEIDKLRSQDKDIGFLQDDFLYWKLL